MEYTIVSDGPMQQVREQSAYHVQALTGPDPSADAGGAVMNYVSGEGS